MSNEVTDAELEKLEMYLNGSGMTPLRKNGIRDLFSRLRAERDEAVRIGAETSTRERHLRRELAEMRGDLNRVIEYHRGKGEP